MDHHRLVRRSLPVLARTALALGFAALGCMGILRSLSAAAPRALPQRWAQASRDGLAPYAMDRVTLLRRQLGQQPDDPRLHLQVARALAARTSVRAHQGYSAAFPDAFLEGRYPNDHFETWRRGWYVRDRDGDLRQAFRHARRASAPGAPLSVRLQALHLTAYLLRQQGHNRAAALPLRELLRQAPRDRAAWHYLSEVYRELGDVSRFRYARRRLDALGVGQAALPLRAWWLS